LGRRQRKRNMRQMRRRRGIRRKQQRPRMTNSRRRQRKVRSERDSGGEVSDTQIISRMLIAYMFTHCWNGENNAFSL
jgi:hypothetical protein